MSSCNAENNLGEAKLYWTNFPKLYRTIEPNIKFNANGSSEAGALGNLLQPEADTRLPQIVKVSNRFQKYPQVIPVLCHRNPLHLRI